MKAKIEGNLNPSHQQKKGDVTLVSYNTTLKFQNSVFGFYFQLAEGTRRCPGACRCVRWGRGGDKEEPKGNLTLFK